MIIGKGLVASAFTENEVKDVILFASGVSNSNEQNPAAFAREKNLLVNTITANPDMPMVYFSSCSVYDRSKHDSPYVQHKLEMEALVKELANTYYVFRVSNAVGRGGNANLLLNYFYRSLFSQKPIEVYRYATRNIIDVEDVKNIVVHYIKNEDKNRIINVAFPQNFYIEEILEVFETIFAPRFLTVYKEEGADYAISSDDVMFYFEPTCSKKSYLENILKKYFVG